MFDHKSAHQASQEIMDESNKEMKKQMTNIKRQISKALKDMPIEELALVNKLIIHRTQIERYFNLHKVLGRQLG